MGQYYSYRNKQHRNYEYGEFVCNAPASPLPTWENSILDLLLMNPPDLVHSTLVIPGVSDHQAGVSTMSLLKPQPMLTEECYKKTSSGSYLNDA